MMRVGLTTSGLKARALPLSYTRLHPPFPHRGIRRVKDPSAPGRNSRASPADNAFCDEFCLQSSKQIGCDANLVRHDGFKPPTSAFEARRSIR